MRKAKILLAEDDLDVVVFVQDQLEALGHQVVVAYNGVEALQKVEEQRFDLVVLDMMMPEMDGYEVCDRLKSSPETQQIPVLILSAKGQLQDKVTGFRKGADDYLPKPYDKAEFEERVIALLRRSACPPYDTTHTKTVFSLACQPTRSLNIRFNGDTSFNAMSKNMLDIEPDSFARYADNIRRFDDEWRFQCKDAGTQLYQKMFAEHPEVFSTFHRAIQAVQTEELLHLRIEAQRDFLRIPVEFLFADHEYLVLKHPLARVISGIHIKKKTLSPEMLNEFCRENKELRILLIASNTKPSIPGVEKEIENLRAALKELFEEKGISVRLKTLPTSDATYETVKKELKNCKYHIIHYAGHGRYEEQSPEKSSLFFWEQTNRQGNVCKMPISELQMLLKSSDVRFMYLSCCLGVTTGESSKLLDDDFLGVADGLMQAGIPAVLGFRYPVSDSGAEILAKEFYRSFAEQGNIDTALFHARCEIAAINRDDLTWVSPILVMQE